MTVIAMASLGACSMTDPGVDCSQAPPGVVRVAAVGDSLTAWAPGDRYLETTWVDALPTEDIAFVGGWARSGARTAEMAEAVTPYCAEVLVVLAGTNDLIRSDDHLATLANLETIVDRAEVSRVVLAAIPPIAGRETEAAAFDLELAALARSHGWTFVDPWTGFRADDGSWARRDFADDGVHPGPEVERAAADAIRDAVRTAAPAAAP